MSSKPRGRAVIINNQYFVKNTQRVGAKRDMEAIKDLFKSLHFNVVAHSDLASTVRDVQEFYLISGQSRPC